MPLTFEEETERFYLDDSAQRRVLLALRRLIGDEKEAEDHMFEVINQMIIDNNEKPIVIKKSYEGLIVRSVRNEWLDKQKKTQKQNTHKEILSSLFSEVSNEENSEEIEHKEILQNNISYVLNQIEEFIPDEFKRRVFLANICENKKYKEIAVELQKAEIKKIDGTNYTPGHLRTINHRTSKKLKGLIEQKYPHFTTKLITKDGRQN